MVSKARGHSAYLPAFCKVMGTGGQLFRVWGAFGDLSPWLKIDMMKERGLGWGVVK